MKCNEELLTKFFRLTIEGGARKAVRGSLGGASPMVPNFEAALLGGEFMTFVRVLIAGEFGGSADRIDERTGLRARGFLIGSVSACLLMAELEGCSAAKREGGGLAAGFACPPLHLTSAFSKASLILPC